MRGLKRLREALPTLGEHELLLVQDDISKAANIAGINDADREWNNLVALENSIAKELDARFPGCNYRSHDFSNAEKETREIYKRIFAKAKGRKKENTK